MIIQWMAIEKIGKSWNCESESCNFFCWDIKVVSKRCQSVNAVLWQDLMEVVRQIDRMEKSTSQNLGDGITPSIDYIQRFHFCTHNAKWWKGSFVVFKIDILWKKMMPSTWPSVTWICLGEYKAEICWLNWTAAELHWPSLVKTDTLIKTGAIIYK